MRRFVTIVTASERVGASWQDDLRRQLGEWGLSLTAEGDIVQAGTRCGPYELHSIEEVRGRFGDAAWLAASCPLVGPALGAISWERRESHGCDDLYFDLYPEDWATLSPPLEDLVVPLMKECRGAFVRVSDGAVREPVRLRARSLRHTIGKYGCDDGAELLTRDSEDYAWDVLSRIGAALRSQGLSGHVGWMDTHHNPIRWSEVEVRRLLGSESRPALWRSDDWSGPPVKDADAAIGDLEVELWTYDFTLGADVAFFSGGE